MLISPLALADFVLTDTDKRAGCVLVDFGYDTTTVSIYKNKILRNLTVIPIGGNNITLDLANVLKLELADAERLKVLYGCAFNNPSKDKDYMEEKISFPELGKEIDRPLFDDIVVARVEEIVENVVNVIKSSGYDSQLFSGVVITGGASKLRGLPDLIEERCKDMKVKVVKNNWNLLHSAFNAPLEKPNENDTLLSLLCSGTVPCCSQQQDSTVIVDGKLFGDQEEKDNTEPEKTPEKSVEKQPEEPVQNHDTGEKKKNKGGKSGSFASFLGRLFGENDPDWGDDNKDE